MANQIISEEFRRMQKLAGIIAEEQLGEAETSFPYEKLKQILIAASEIYPPSSKYPVYSKNDIKPTLQYIMKLEKGLKEDDVNIFNKLEKTTPPEIFNTIGYKVDTEEFNKWDDLGWELASIGNIWREYDWDFAADQLKDLAKAINEFEL